MPPAPRPPRLSRRHFLAVAPTALAIEAGAAPTGSLPERARAWNGTRELVRGLLLRWQDLEKEIQRRTGSLKLRKAAREAAGKARAEAAGKGKAQGSPKSVRFADS